MRISRLRGGLLLAAGMSLSIPALPIDPGLIESNGTINIPISSNAHTQGVTLPESTRSVLLLALGVAVLLWSRRKMRSSTEP